MSRGVNKVILVGNCCKDPELKYMPSGNAVTNMNVATSERWKDKQTGQQQERTEFHKVVFFNRLGEIAGEYLRKGSKIYVEGSLRTRKWQDQSGQDRFTTEIVASELQMLDSRSENMAQGQPQGGYQQPQQPAAQPMAQPQPMNQGMQQPAQRPMNQGMAQGQAMPSHAAPQSAQRQPQQPMQQPQAQAAAQPTQDFGNFDDDIPFMRLGPEADF